MIGFNRYVMHAAMAWSLLAFCSMGAVAQTPSPARKSQSVSVGSKIPDVTAEPTWEETFEFLRTKTEGCVTERTLKSGHQFTYEVTRLESPKAFVVVVTERRYMSASPTETIWASASEDTRTIDFRDLFAEVAIDTNDGNTFPYANCSVSGCVALSSRRAKSVPPSPPDWSQLERAIPATAESRITFRACRDGTKASQALLHGIRLAGGKRQPL